MNKQKLLKTFKYILWFVLFSILLLIFYDLMLLGFELIYFDVTGNELFLPLSSLSLDGLGVFGCFLLLLDYHLNNLVLYIYSYKLYFGNQNRNWYKFFREKEKTFKKQVSLEYSLLNKNKK